MSAPAETTAPPCLLLTGFEPFGGEPDNPSWRLAQALDGETIAGLRVQAVQLPCVFAQAGAALQTALEQHRPQLVLATGQAQGRCDLSFERVAINLVDARIADNAGAQPVDDPVTAGGAPAYFSSLPVKAMVAAARAAGVPASLSHSAGTFVCNQVFYLLMQALQVWPGVRGGFMHVPLLPAQAARHPGVASLPLDTLVAGTRAALAAAVQHTQDLRLPGGTVA